MRSFVPLLLLLTLVAACGDRNTDDRTEEVSAPCNQQMFEGSKFTVCSEPGGKVEIHTFGDDGSALRKFVALETDLGDRADEVRFAMNAGMFDEAGGPIGLLIEDGKTIQAINRREGAGNFHLMPNGVFIIRTDGRAEVVSSARFEPEADIAYASQSGPMLVIDGELHPKFEPDGRSRNIRNGVGIAQDGTPLFAISQDLVSLGKFARFFRDSLKTRNALYFDGAVSSLWYPAGNRRDIGPELGPMVVVFRASESAPGREDRATP